MYVASAHKTTAASSCQESVPARYVFIIDVPVEGLTSRLRMWLRNSWPFVNKYILYVGQHADRPVAFTEMAAIGEYFE